MNREVTAVSGVLATFTTWLGICMGLSITGTGFMVMFWFYVFLGIMLVTVIMLIAIWKYL